MPVVRGMVSESQGYVVRANRGRPRIWIEGARLERAGFNFRDHYTVESKPDQLILKRGHGRMIGRYVSGKEGRPIIDITGANCAPFVTGDAVTITYQNRTITIKKGKQS